MEKLFDRVEQITRSVLIRRKKRKMKIREKQAKKHPVIDWIEAFLWAAVVVLLINQYLLQAYQIPSGSMIDTLLIKDRIFVNKIIYGPELIPGAIKLPSPIEPERNEVIIFENPSYLSKGPIFDILQRIIYMITFSLVDIDSDPAGNPRPHFLIKRAVGMEGDRLRVERGELLLRPPGMDHYIPETTFRTLAGFSDPSRRMIDPSDYESIEASGMADGYSTMGLAVPPALTERITPSDSPSDMYQWMKLRQKVLYQAYPVIERYGEAWRKLETGWYIPEGWIFPLGDNRDNSRDARYFGPVQLKKVLGRAMFKYWPANRIGPIR